MCDRYLVNRGSCENIESESVLQRIKSMCHSVYKKPGSKTKNLVQREICLRCKMPQDACAQVMPGSPQEGEELLLIKEMLNKDDQ